MRKGKTASCALDGFAEAAIAWSAAREEPARRAGRDPWMPRHGDARHAPGVPMVVIPGLAGDQPFVAAAVQEWGAGRALPGDTSADDMCAAAQEVLSTPAFRNTAREKSALLAGVDSAANAANEVEALLASQAQKTIFAGAGSRNSQCQQVA